MSAQKVSTPLIHFSDDYGALNEMNMEHCMKWVDDNQPLKRSGVFNNYLHMLSICVNALPLTRCSPYNYCSILTFPIASCYKQIKDLPWLQRSSLIKSNLPQVCKAIGLASLARWHTMGRSTLWYAIPPSFLYVPNSSRGNREPSKRVGHSTTCDRD